MLKTQSDWLYQRKLELQDRVSRMVKEQELLESELKPILEIRSEIGLLRSRIQAIEKQLAPKVGI